jgi:hypothetical protein
MKPWRGVCPSHRKEKGTLGVGKSLQRVDILEGFD